MRASANHSRRSPPHFRPFRPPRRYKLRATCTARDRPGVPAMARGRHGRLTDSYIESLTTHDGGRERIVRDGAIPGFLIRVGLRKRSFELRIEKSPKATRQLGYWPGVPASEARQIAEDLWQKHRRGETLDDGPRKGEETVATTWPRFQVRLDDQGRSRRTI